MRVRALAVAAAVGLILPAAMASSAQAATEDPCVTAVHAVASAPEVDVFVNGAVPVEFDDLVYGDVDFIQVPSGTAAAVSVTAATATSPTPPFAPGLAGDFTVTGDVSLVAQVDAAGVPLLKAYPDDLSPTPAGQARIIVRHVAQAPTVSVDANGAELFPAISNGQQVAATIPAGGYTVDVKIDGVVVPELSIPFPLPVSAGFVYIVYAAGDPESGYRLIDEPVDVGQAPAVTATTPSATTTTTSQAATTTRPAIPTAVPAGDGSSGWAGPLGVPAMLAIALAVGLALAVGFGLRGSASHRR